MKLPSPVEKIAGCCWLPRFAEKVRRKKEGKLPLLYRIALGNPIGIDGYFLRHFELSLREFESGVLSSESSEKLEKWFISRSSVTNASIEKWNNLAPHLGSKGYPGYITRCFVRWIFYPSSINRPVNSLFESIEQDEKQ